MVLQSRIVPAIKLVRSSPAEAVPIERAPGSGETLKQILDAYVHALAAANSESTGLRRGILVEECVQRTQSQLDAYVFTLTAVVKDVLYNEVKQWAYIGFDNHVELVPGQSEPYLFFTDPRAYINMSKTDAVNIKAGNKLVIQGRISLGYVLDKPGQGFSYMSNGFSITHDTCRIVN